MSEQEPTDEELRAAFEEELKRIRVEDVLVQTAVTLVNLAGRRLGLAPGAEEERDLGQAKLSIEGVRALLPLLPDEVQQALREPLSQLQMAFAREAQGPGEPGAGDEGAGPGGQQAPPQQQQPPQPPRREGPKIWTPGSS